MRSYLNFACSCAMFLVASAACGQQVEGYTTLDIDPSTNAVTVTCETSIDSDYYASFVSCSVTDGNGTQVASGSQIDNYGYEGYAQVVLTFTGTAGTTYLATGVHSAQPTMPFDTPEPQPGRPVNQFYYDPYNYNSFNEGANQTYVGSFDLYGPGPEVQVKRKPLHIADTTATGTVSKPCPTSIVIDQTWQGSLQANFPHYLTGIGILTRMKVGPLGPDYASVEIDETVSPGANSCPVSTWPNTSLPFRQTPFFVGYGPLVWEGNTYLSTQNAFYDQHVQKSASNILDPSLTNYCIAEASQTYTCKGNVIASFTITNYYATGIIMNNAVTYVTVTKQ